MNFLNAIRAPETGSSRKRRLLAAAGELVFGLCLGVFSKYLDCAQADLPGLLGMLDEWLDLHNFLGGFAPWVLLAACIAVYSPSPWQAAARVPAFFLGMLAGYYGYGYFVGGFFPRSYALIWMVFTAASPFLAYPCWYAKGKGFPAVVLSSGVLAVLICAAFSWGVWYLSITRWLNVLMLCLGILVFRRTARQTLVMLALAALTAVLLEAALPVSIF